MGRNPGCHLLLVGYESLLLGLTSTKRGYRSVLEDGIRASGPENGVRSGNIRYLGARMAIPPDSVLVGTMASSPNAISTAVYIVVL